MIFRNGNIIVLFDPSYIGVNTIGNNMDKWVNYRGEVLQPPFSLMSAESVAQSRNFYFENLSFTDPGFFTAGNLHNHLDAWRDISPSSEVISWLENGVNIQTYFRDFKV